MNTDTPFQRGARVAFYLRDSGGQEQELSIAQQERVLRDWAEKNDLVVGEIFRDTMSGTSTKGRNDFMRMMTYFQHKPPEAGIAVWRSNRFGRNIDDTQYFKADLRRRGYIVHSITDNIPDGAAGKLYEFVLDWKDEVFSQQLSEDIKRGLSDIVRIYGAVPGRIPFGFLPEPVQIGTRRNGQPHILHRWKPDPLMIPTIQRAFSLRASGATFAQIQAETHFYKGVLSWSKFFTNKIYKGTLEYGDLVVENYCEPIVSAELWQIANQVSQSLRDNPKKRGQARRSVSSFLLSGLAHCQICGRLMNGQVVKKYRYYVCPGNFIYRDCDARAINATALDAEVMDNITNYLLGPDNLSQIRDRLGAQYKNSCVERDAEREIKTLRFETVKRNINNLTSAIADHGASDALMTALRKLETESVDLRIKIDALTTSPVPEWLETVTTEEIAAALRQHLTQSTVEQKRTYLSAFVESFHLLREVDRVECKIIYYPPTSLVGNLLGYHEAIPVAFTSVSINHYDFSFFSKPPKKRHQPP